MIFTNTQYFKEAGLDWIKNGGKYTKAPVGSLEYSAYWKEQNRRCEHGYKVGDIWITGRHYFHLNFQPMWKLPDKNVLKALEERKDNSGKISKLQIEKVFDFARFNEMQFEWWRFKHIAWYGGEFMGVQSNGGKHLTCAKTRGAGMSYMEAADGVYNYNFLDGSKSYYFASAEAYLTEDGILNKVSDGLNWIDSECSFWKQHRHKHKTLMHQKASYLDSYGNEKGTGSEIMGQVVDNPNKTRGKRGRKASFEEAGSFKNLKKSVEIALGSLRDGDIYVGQMSIFGCVCAGSEVYTKTGKRTTIELLKQEDGITGYNGTTSSEEDIVWMKPIARKECVEVTLETGIKLRCSTDHPILSTNKNLKAKPGRLQKRRVEFKEAATLSTKDMVAVIESTPFFGSVHNTYAYTTGYLIGDGYYCSSIECVIDNPVSKALIEEEITIPLVLKREHETVTSYSINGPIRQYLKSNGMFGQSKQNKRLPKDWDEYDKESLAKLLAGYFDADGNTKKDNYRGVSVIYSSVVPELLEEVRKALMKFGVHSSIGKELVKGGYTEEHIMYRLYITRAESVENFRKEIPVVCPWKQVPTQSKRINKLLREAEFVKTEKYAHDKHLKPLTGAVLYRVKSVKSIGMQDIYNLNAGNTHTYLANNIITHNTGGEEGPSIEGLEEIFSNPKAWDMLAFPNVYEESDDEIGYFIPSYRANFPLTDKDGNIEYELALNSDAEKRKLKELSGDPKVLDAYKAEYPQKPSELFSRLINNDFNVTRIKEQIRKIETSTSIKMMLRNGELVASDGGNSINGVEFIVTPNAAPILKYPHQAVRKQGVEAEDLNGCVTILEKPIRGENGKTYDGMYIVVFDPYYKDDAVDLTSLFSIQVWKQPNKHSNTFTGVPVAWYTGRPNKLSKCHEILYNMTRYYGTTMQGEIGGGGQGVLDFMKIRRALHMVENEVEMLHNKEYAGNTRNAAYLMNITTDKKKLGMSYLVDWHTEVRGLQEDGTPVVNIDRVYDIAFLRELAKGGARNSDRMSAAIVAMFMLKENIYKTYEETDKEKGFLDDDRVLFGGNPESSLVNNVTDYFTKSEDVTSFV